LLGRSKVQGMSRAAHALHGGPDSSHCDGASVGGQIEAAQNRRYLNFTHTARVASLPQAVGLLLRRVSDHLAWRRHEGLLVGAQSMVGLLLEHIAEALDAWVDVLRV